ncbi:Lipin/Ned1/Smp2-domain-containing protein [Russula compacta]|nr:Lipin/Ned1/Smp2-domain-containing protein [Russula compacta]
MNYLWGAVNAISAPYQYYKDINPSTLTGAIDVIVVRRPASNGTGTMELICSPFHVRFGKWQVLRPSEKKVDVAVNGKSVPFNMKIGDAGEAFFIFETDSDVPDDLITSPLLEPTEPVSSDPLPLEDFGRFGARDRKRDHMDDGVSQEPDFLDLDAPSTSLFEVSKTSSSNLPQPSPGASSFRAGDSSSLVNTRTATRTISIEAEKEIPRGVQDNPVVSDIELDMGGYHTLHTLKAQRASSPQDDADGSQRSYPEESRTTVSTLDTSPGRPYTPPLHPALPSHEPIPFPSLRPPSALSPDLAHHHSSVSPPRSSATPDEYSWEWGEFPQRSQIQMQHPTHSGTASLKSVHGTEPDEQLVVSEPGEFQRSKSLPPELELDASEGVPSTSLQSNEQLNGHEPLSDVETGFDHDSRMSSRERRSWVRWWRRDSGHPRSVDVRPSLKSAASTPLPSETSSIHVPTPDDRARYTSVLSLPASSQELRASVPSSSSERPKMRYAKTLRLTSEQLQVLDLRPGANTITFSLSSSGVVACAARIFLWEHTDSVVVSDIDGTITKSDALGHVFNLIGRDWTHLGVAKLYTDICKNGFKIMYLTSRAIGQADSTRYYLQGIKQNDYQLPEGPVIMSPDRLMASLHREVIMRKPEVFKMACLRDIQRLFGPAAPLPFYAGFGNRISDALSYRSVNSESVQSYIHMTDLVDQMFPPITHKWESEFTDHNYWKAPLAEFPLPVITPPSPALSARSDTSNQSAFARLRNFSLPSRGRNMDVSSSHNHQRQLSSIERLGNALAGLASRSVSPSTPSAYESESEEDCDSHDASDDHAGRRRRLRKRSTRSMPGSLPGSRASSDDEDLEFGVTGKATDGSILDPAAEAVEGEFDEDLFAAGEMQKVPFL